MLRIGLNLLFSCPFILCAELIATSSLAASAKTESQEVVPTDLAGISSFDITKLSLSTEAEVPSLELHSSEHPTISSSSNSSHLPQVQPDKSESDSPNSPLLRIDDWWSDATTRDSQ